MLTDAQKDNYLDEPYKCPYCGSEDIEADNIEDCDDETVYRGLCCNSCGKAWDDVYILAGVIGGEKGDSTATHVLNNAQWGWLQEIAKIPIKGESDYRKLDVHDATGFIRIARDIVGGA